MPEAIIVVLAGIGTALATGLGAVPVFFLGDRAAQLTPALLGFAAGVMAVASVAGLLIPAGEEGSALAVLGGLACGAAFVTIARRRLNPETTFMGRSGPSARVSALVFLVLFVHSFPEGLAVGTAYASDRAGLSLFVILAIALQNIPEGTSVAIPMAAAGFSRRSSVLGRRRHQRSAAGRRARRLPSRSGDPGPPSLFIRSGGGVDAGPGCRGDDPQGLLELGSDRADAAGWPRERVLMLALSFLLAV